MAQPSRPVRHVVGVMTGTSIDGMDAALARIEGGGLAMKAALVRHRSQSLGDLAPRLRAAADQQPMASGAIARLALELGTLHAEAIGALVEGEESIDLIALHGQTIFHQPPVSWQLVNPGPVAERFRCPVVFDLRQGDLAAGGQGAPITPLADWILFRHSSRRRAIVNLGGFCNATMLPAGDSPRLVREIAGFDWCACNQVLDAVAREALGAAFDQDGAAASRGQVNPALVESLLNDLTRQRQTGRSLGTGDEAARWARDSAAHASGADLAASAVEAIARCISEAFAAHQPDEIVLAGGGAKNRALVERLGRLARVPMSLSDALGVPIEGREAVAMAVLGALCADGVAMTLPQVTGCREPAPISGAWRLPRGVS